MKETKVTIVIPTYNRARAVCEAVRSALLQNGGSVEVIVIDDGSTDDTFSALEEVPGNVKVLRRHHEGACAARNTGLYSASSENVVFLDSDDYYENDQAGPLANARSRDDLDMAIGFHALKTSSEKRSVKFLRPGCTRADILEAFSDGKIVQTAAICWRKSFLTKIGGWNPTVTQWQDVELYVRALLNGACAKVYDYEGAVVNEYVDHGRVSHRVNSENFLRQSNFIHALREKAVGDDSKYVANLFYKLARHAYRHGFVSIGNEALANARLCGLVRHRGSMKHRVLSSLVGLRFKEYISTSLQPISYHK